jgi:predicted DNA-binding protein with PD1-like motif
LQHFVQHNQIQAAALVTVVGSLTHAVAAELRYANQPEGTASEGHFEIVSMTGTLDASGGHVHISLADGSGRVFGGHMLPGCLVYTTAEVVLVQLKELRFAREHCPESGWDELVVYKSKEQDT